MNNIFKNKVLIQLMLLFAMLPLAQCGNMAEESQIEETDLSRQTEYPGDYSLTDEEQVKKEEIQKLEPTPEEKMAKLAAKLNLTAEQIREAEPLFAQLHLSMKEIHDEMRARKEARQRPTREEMDAIKTRIDTIHQNTRESLRVIFTDEQNAAFDELKKECDKNRPPFPPPPPRKA